MSNTNTKPGSPRRAVIYARISADKTGQAAGVRRQEAECRDLADRLGLEVVTVFTDNDISAASGKHRPAWEALLALVESDGIDTLVCWHTDRLYRRPTDLERLLDLLDAGRLPGMVHAVRAGDLDLSTASGRMVARILVAVSAQEVELGRERMVAAKRAKALAGEPNVATRPFGFEPGGITHRPAEADLIREAADRIIAGESLRAIGQDWTQRGIPTAAGAPRWRSSSLQSLLTNPRLIGQRTYRGEVVGPGTWDPILDEATWRRMLTALADPARTRRGGRYAVDGTKERHWLSGVARCGRCGTRMQGSRRGTIERGAPGAYACPPPQNGGCGRVSINGSRLEDYVSRLMFDRWAATDLGDLNPAPQGSRRAEILTALDEVHQRLVDIGEAIGNGTLSVTVAAAAERAALDEQRRLDAELRRLSVPDSAVRHLPTGITEAEWALQTRDELHDLAEALFADLTVRPAAHKGQRFTPTRVEVTWADLSNDDADAA